MRRFAVLLSALAFLPLAAFAQNEKVDANSMTGIWKLDLATPNHLFANQYCRVRQVDDDLAWRCLPGGKWSGTLDGATFHISAPGDITYSYNSMKISMPIPGGWAVRDANLDSPLAFHGTMGFKLIGFSLFQSEQSQFTGAKFVLPETSPDAAGKSGLLKTVLGELANGAITSPHDPNLTNDFRQEPNKPDDIRPLGDIHAIIYLGEGKIRRWDPKDPKTELPPFVFSNYQVEFANGERLCGIHQREDGAVDGFLCV